MRTENMAAMVLAAPEEENAEHAYADAAYVPAGDSGFESEAPTKKVSWNVALLVFAVALASYCGAKMTPIEAVKGFFTRSSEPYVEVVESENDDTYYVEPEPRGFETDNILDVEAEGKNEVASQAEVESKFAGFARIIQAIGTPVFCLIFGFGVFKLMFDINADNGKRIAITGIAGLAALFLAPAIAGMVEQFLLGG